MDGRLQTGQIRTWSFFNILIRAPDFAVPLNYIPNRVSVCVSCALPVAFRIVRAPLRNDRLHCRSSTKLCTPAV